MRISHAREVDSVSIALTVSPLFGSHIAMSMLMHTVTSRSVYLPHLLCPHLVSLYRDFGGNSKYVCTARAHHLSY